MEKVIIIAEAGVNHNGDLDLAMQLIDAAAQAGADYVKFQTFKAENLVSPLAKKALYQTKNSAKEGNQFEMLKQLEISDEWYSKMISRCIEKGVKFLSTGFDQESIDFLSNLNIPFFKIPSGEITNKPFLKHIAKYNKDIILSTGMSNIEEIRNAITVFESEGIRKERITVLHCTTEYPTPMNEVNLFAMQHIAKELGVKIGYSDHTLGIEVPIAAVALGATIIEKHFTMNRNLSGPDHAASLEPNELKSMISCIRNIEVAISGNGIKEPSTSELKNIIVARKSLHLLNDIKQGEILTENDLIALRPGDGISPMDIEKVIGKSVVCNLTKGTKIKKEHFHD